jgi:CDP-paratose 2-epimerase
MSCIYGPHQHGNEDQGWVAHFLIHAGCGKPLTIYGNGLQVRDVLYVDDLLDAFQLAMHNAETFAGRAFNIGGGPHNTLSLLELIEHLRQHGARVPPVQHSDSRIGDQRYYVSDTGAFTRATGWWPRVAVNDGLARLGEWLDERVPRLAPESLQAVAGG